MSEAAPALHAALRRLLPKSGSAELAAAQCRALDGGLHRRSFLVTVAGRDYVLRLPTAGAPSLLDVASEAAAMRGAAAAGLAPDVVAVDAPNGLLLTEYRARAEPWTPAAARRSANIERAAEVLRRLHQVPADLPAYAAERIAKGYVAALGAGAAPELAQFGGARIRAWADELIELARRHDAAHPPAVFCHNDLVAANVLDDGALVLVDFEYAVRGSPLLDLAGLAGMNDFTAAQHRALLAAYHRDETVPRSALAELERGVRMVRLMAFFWARVGERCVADAAPYSRLGAELAARLGEPSK